ncbi:hypothetical protein A9K58_08455 [Stenotrophomonas maltophilia]|uniref:Uncharacterized protein n=1 Tax=Stenotrophomonas maltophilia TaxID=40324 RepID=A0A1A6XYH8_STEMA|nr:hypothetical protein A9K58_08455 [Stenotrophomonas maltophilia]
MVRLLRNEQRSALTDQYMGQRFLVRGELEYDLDSVHLRGPVSAGARCIGVRWLYGGVLPDNLLERNAGWRDIEGQLCKPRIVGITSQRDVPDFKVTQPSAFCDPLIPQALSRRFS